MARAPLSLTSKPPLPPPTITPLRHQRSPLTTVRVSATTVTTTAMPDHHPSLEISGGAVDRFLPAFKSLHLPYKPFPIVGWNRHIETIFAAFFRKVPDVRYRRECLRTKDDGTIALDWASDDHRSLPADAPILILLPGLTGGSQDSYVKHMLVKARSKGWRVVVLHTPLFEDIEDKFNVQVGLNPQTVREYDEAITRVALGFNSVDDYYSNSCSCHVIQHVRIPLLCIQAANDPIAPIEGTPREDIKGNPNCMLIVTPQGGHLGWVAGDEAPFGAPWTDNVVMDFLEHLQKAAPISKENSSNAEDVQQGSEDVHQAKV
ncbi:Esterase/lipase/thioesterase family protein isoform 3 [Theobroma cacao]|uniref:Esterase/lipase/thioesterase family protein isoform 3 n=1 Tax=Theobroma cacao TaxID=3641 RepID=A0A061F5N0_THECC|nr:Esterase/lipase/thioesterase family protein isoform 3 [Theobroma cacao]